MGNIQVTISEIPFATVVLVPWLFFAVSALFEDFPRLGLRQVAGLVAVVGWALGLVLDTSEDHRYLRRLGGSWACSCSAGCGSASSGC